MELATGHALRRRLAAAGVAMLVIYGGGTLGYFLLGHGRWTLGESAYMTIISVTTVGYGEVLDGFAQTPYARLWTSFLLVAGVGIEVYAVSLLTTFLVEGEFLQLRRYRKMQKRIQKLSHHVIVCGVGGTGKHVVDELRASKWQLIAVDTDAERLERCVQSSAGEVAVLQGDATDDQMLLAAGIERAYGVIASLPDDKGNLYVVITARGLNPRLRIVAKAVDMMAEGKLTTAGADAVVSVNTIGGLRMTSEMIRPNVVSFLDKMLRDKDKNLRFEEVTIPERSPLVNTRLAQSDIRKERNLLIVAVRNPATGEYTYSPGPQFTLEAGMTLVLLGETAAVHRLRTSRLFEGIEAHAKGETEDPASPHGK